MRLRISQGMKRMLAVCVTTLLLTGGAARAATIGYWSFDDAAPGTDAGTLVTQINSPDIDGTAGTYNDTRTQYPGTPVLPIHHASRPGGGIQVINGVGGAAVNSENTTSLKFANPAASGYSPDAGFVAVQDPGASTLLEPAGDFTIEGFVRLNNATILWASLVGKDRSGLVSWGINTSSTGNALSVRIDSLNGSVGQTNQGFTALNFNLADGQWHHFAMTYTASERKIRLYGDYNLLTISGSSGGVIANNGVILYDDSALYFGGRAGSGGLDGNLDEIRYSDTVLPPDQFLRIVPSPAHPSYQPDGTIKSTHVTMTMSDSGVIDMVDDAGNTHGIHLSMVYRATGAWFTAAHTLSKVKTVNAQTRTTTFTGIIQPPTGSIDLTPIPFRFWMQLKDDDKVRIGVEYDTPLPILEILSYVELKDHARPRTSFEGYYIRADGTTYLISATDPAGTRTLTLGPVQTAVLFDDVLEHRIQFLKVESGAESLRDYNTAPTPYEEVRYTLTSGMANRLICDMVLPDEPASLIPASPVFQPDGRIVSGGTSLAISSGMFNLVDTNAITYGIHLSMSFAANSQWFTAGSTAVTDQLTTVDTVAKQVTFTGLINPPAGSLDMTLIPLSYWMQLQTNGTVRIQADFTRSGSIFDILSMCNLNSHSRPRSAYSGHIIQADGDSFPIANDPPSGTSPTVLKQGTIQQTRFMSDSPLQTITMSKVTSAYEMLNDYNVTNTAPFIEMRYKTDDATNTAAMDITFPPTDTNPSSETYGGVDFWKSDNLRMPPFGTSANLVSNPSFEHDLQYWRWNTFSGIINDSLVARYYVIDSTTAYHGNRSLKLIGKQGQAVAQLASFAIPVEAGQTYTLSFYAKTDNAAAAKLWLTGNTALWGTWISGLPGSLTLTTNWTRYTYTFIAPNGVVAIGFTQCNPSADCNAWLDAVQIEKAPAATAFTQRPASMSFLTDRQGNLFQPGEAPVATVRIIGTPNTSGTLTVYSQDFSGAESKKQTTGFTIAANGETSVAQTWTTGLPQNIYVARMETTIGGVTYRDFGRLAVMPSVPLNQPGRQLFTMHGGANVRYAEWDRQLSYYTKLGIGSAIYFDPAPASLYPLLTAYGITQFSSILEGGEGVAALNINLRTDYDLTTQELADLQTYAYNKALANPQITYWKLHNEPNTSQLDATHMNQMLAAVGAAAAGVKQANPNAKIITNDPSNMTVTSGIAYIDSFLANGGGSFCDIVGIHPYRAQPETPDLDSDCASLMQVLANRNFTGDVWFSEGIYHQNYVLPIYGLNTHVGCSSDQYRGGTFAYDMGWGERMCAAYTARSWLIAMKYSDRVKLYVDWGLASNTILDYDFTPGASIFSVNTLVRTLGGSTYAGQPSIDPAIRSYVFTDTQGQQVAAIWYYSYQTDHGDASPGKLDVTYLLSQYNTSDLEMIDFTGNVSSVVSKVQLQPWPIFVRAKTGTATQLINALNQATYTPAN